MEYIGIKKSRAEKSGVVVLQTPWEYSLTHIHKRNIQVDNVLVNVVTDISAENPFWYHLVSSGKICYYLVLSGII